MSPPPLRFGVPLAAYTTFGIGGPAGLFTEPRGGAQLLAALLWAREQDVAHLVLGGGSNVLVDDTGYDGLVIRNAGSHRIELLPGDRLRAESGVTIARLIALTLQQGLSGLEHFAGIPSTLGGALRQNLHFLSPSRDRTLSIGNLLVEATVLVDTAVERVDRDWFGFGCDAGALREDSAVILDATLQLAAADPAALAATVHANLAWRRKRHPPRAETRSAGCVFRNPGNTSAARAIEAAGLKGAAIGGAAISRRHANFIVNRGDATAADVRSLVRLATDRVAEHSGLQLEPEIAFVGFAGRGRSGSVGDSMRILSVSGAVERPLDLSADELAALADTELASDLHCHEGWSRHGERWRGVRLATLLARVGAREDGRYVTVASGDYSAVLTREQANDGRVLLAVEHNGHRLDRAHGLPRLVGRSDWDCFLSVKSVDRIRLTREPEAATAEKIALARLGG